MTCGCEKGQRAPSPATRRRTTTPQRSPSILPYMLEVVEVAVSVVLQQQRHPLSPLLCSPVHGDAVGWLQNARL